MILITISGSGNISDYDPELIRRDVNPKNPEDHHNSARYDSRLADSIVNSDISLETKLKLLVDLSEEHGKNEEMEGRLSIYKNQNGYRRPAIGNSELRTIVDQVLGEQETEPETKSSESIDDVVDSYKPSMFKVAAKGTLNLASNAVSEIHRTHWYYPLVGLLPAKYQAKFAEKYGDKPLYYTISNAVAEGVVAAGGVIGYAFFQKNNSLSSGVVLGLIIGASNVFARFLISDGSKEVKGSGSILSCLLFYTALYSIAAVKAIKNGVFEAYASAYKEIEDEQKAVLTGQDHKRVNAEAGVRIATSSARLEEQPEIVDEEFDCPEGLEEEPIKNLTFD